MNNNYIPNTSAIPNILFDYWMLILSPAEFKVLMCIARKTYGWHKNNDLISLKQIEKMTGLHRSGIVKNVDALVERGLLNKIKSKTSDGDDAPNRYEINVYCVEGGSLQNRLPVVDSVDQGVVYSVDPQKKDYTKENIQKNTPPLPPQKQATKVAKSAKADEIDLDSSSNQKEKKPIDDPSVLELATIMVEELKKVNPEYHPPKNLTPMLTHIDFLLRIDKRQFAQITDVFKWALADSFWADKMFKPNPAKYLREKFDQLYMKMIAKPPKKERKFAPCSDDNEALRIAKEMAARAI